MARSSSRSSTRRETRSTCPRQVGAEPAAAASPTKKPACRSCASPSRPRSSSWSRPYSRTVASMLKYACDPRSCSRTRLPSTSAPSASTASVPLQPVGHPLDRVEGEARAEHPEAEEQLALGLRRAAGRSSRWWRAACAGVRGGRGHRRRARAGRGRGARPGPRASARAAGPPRARGRAARCRAPRRWPRPRTAFSAVTSKSGLTARARSTNSSDRHRAGAARAGCSAPRGPGAGCGSWRAATRTSRQQRAQLGRRVDDLLDVVEHEEHAPSGRAPWRSSR